MTTQTFECPRCAGTGEYELICDDGNGFAEVCKPCTGSGQVTKENWNAWREAAFGRSSAGNNAR
jgi:hypothetical protein